MITRQVDRRDLGRDYLCLAGDGYEGLDALQVSGDMTPGAVVLLRVYGKQKSHVANVFLDREAATALRDYLTRLLGKQ